MNKYDCIVVGSGFAGTVNASILAEQGYHVLVLEKRSHIAGNTYDETEKNGILIQKYGPHIFHTNNEKVVNFLKKFGEWEDYQLACKVFMNDKFTPSPFNYQTIDDYYSIEEARELKKQLKLEYPNQNYATIVELLESTNPIVKSYANFLYDNDYSLYTAKQWGIKPSEIDISVLKRVPVLFSYEQRYFHDRFEMTPQKGYTNLFENMLKHPNIEVRLNVNCKDIFTVDDKYITYHQEPITCPIIYTGALDELFDYRYGLLPYRTLQFKYEILQQDSFQDAPVVAYPQVSDFTRITEYKKLPIQDIKNSTIIAKEYPSQYGLKSKNSEPYYPIINDKNKLQYQQYLDLAIKIPNLYLCGRLAEYQYFNMDQVIEQAFLTAKKVLDREEK